MSTDPGVNGPPPTPPPPAALLLVGGAQPLLNALQRALRACGCTIHTATSGEAALRILDEREIAVLICDQRMPGMPGDEVLARAYDASPDTYRITLTGYTDMEAAKRSINDGRVNLFLTKPWDDAHLVSAVHDGSTLFHTIRENRRLHQLTCEQNAKLEAWNQQLEATVADRTEQLRAHNRQLQDLQAALRDSLHDTVAVLASVLEAIDPALGVHSRRVAKLAARIASELDLDEHACRDTEFAAYLHDIGMIARLHQRDPKGASRPPSTKDRATVAESGWALLIRVRGFEAIAEAVRSQEERFDGHGEPETLAADEIPIAARVIAACNAYDKALHSAARPTELTTSAARDAVVRAKGKALDPRVVDALLACLESAPGTGIGGHEVEVSPKQLRVGMVIVRDVVSARGLLLLKANSEVSDDLIHRLQRLGEDQMLGAGVFVRSADTHQEAGDAPARRSA